MDMKVVFIPNGSAVVYDERLEVDPEFATPDDAGVVEIIPGQVLANTIMHGVLPSENAVSIGEMFEEENGMPSFCQIKSPNEEELIIPPWVTQADLLTVLLRRQRRIMFKAAKANF